jgi:hypothetical protein
MLVVALFTTFHSSLTIRLPHTRLDKSTVKSGPVTISKVKTVPARLIALTKLSLNELIKGLRSRV